MSKAKEHDNFLAEWTQVYLHGNIVLDKDVHDNLRDLTMQFDDGRRQPNQIYAILRGMGIDQYKAACAVKKYVIAPRELRQKNNMTMESNFNITTLKDKLVELKEGLEAFKAQDESKISFSADQALTVVEKHLSKFDTLASIEKMIKEKKSLLETVEGQDETEETKSLIFKLTGEIATLEQNLSDTVVKNKFKMVRESLRELKVFDWLIPVSTFINEMNVIFNKNKFASKIDEAYHSLNTHKYKDMYKMAADDLEKILEHNEDAIRGELEDILTPHKWIPEVNNILLEFANEENRIASGRQGEVSKVYSPVEMREDGGFNFALNNKFYKLAEGKIEEINENEVSSKFINVKNALNQFTIKGGKFVAYSGKNIVEISEGSVVINGQLLENNSIENFRNYMRQIQFYGVNELHKIDEMCYLIESCDMVMDLDFITSIKSKTLAGVFVNVINTPMTEGIYINKINPAMGVNELVETKSGEEAQAHVSELIDIDISKIVYEELEEENRIKVELDNKKNEIKEKISFLESKKNEITEAIQKYGKTEELEAALQLLDEELSNFDKELQVVYSEIAGKKKVNERKHNPEDMGYVLAEFKNAIGKYKKGDEIYVKADEFTSKGGNDDISVMDKDGKTSSIKKRYLKVSN